MYYKLVDKEVVKLQLGEMPDFKNRGMFRDTFTIYGEEVQVSTVFLHMDHSFNGGPPLLFETMVFGGLHDNHQVRYTSWDEAEKGHNEICQMVLEVISNDREKKINNILKKQ